MKSFTGDGSTEIMSSITDISDSLGFLKKVYFFLVAALIPLASPSLPGNTILVDFVNIIFFSLFGVVFAISKKPIEFPLLASILLILLGSIFALFNAQALMTSVYTIVQDLYLFIFFLFLYNLIEDQNDLKFIVKVWLLVSFSEAILAILNTQAHIAIGSSKVSEFEDFTRARATFGNSDAAASYFGVAFFLIFSPFFKNFWKTILGIIIFVGMFETKSMSALLGFSVGGIIFFLSYWFYVDRVKKLQLGLVVLLVVTVVLTFVIPKILEAENFLDRMPRSAQTRQEIWVAGYKSFKRHPFGIGPGAFKKIGRGPINNEGKRAELHSDYISHLVERGPFGFVGLLLIYGTLMLMIIAQMKKARTDQEFLWASGLMASLFFIVVDALNHEGMHYRHIWFVFALIAVQRKFSNAKQQQIVKSISY